MVVGHTQQRLRLYYGWWIVGASVLVGLYVGGIVVYGFTAMFEPIVLEFGWSYAAVSLAASLRGVESGLLEPVVGRLVDRWGARRLIFFGGLFVTAGLLLLSNTMSLVMFYGSFMLLAIGMSCCGPTVLVTGVADWFRARQALATGIALSGFGLGGLILPLMVTLIAQHGWRAAFGILATGALVLVLPLSLVFRRQTEESRQPFDDLKPEPAGNAHVNTRIRHQNPTELPTVARHATRTRFFWLLTLAFTLHSAIVITVVTHVMPYLGSIGFQRMTAGAVATAIPVLSVLGRIGLGLMGDRLSRTRVCVVAYGMMALGLLCFFAIAQGLGNWFLYVFLLLFGVGYGGVTALRPVLTREYFGRERFGSIFGLIVGINALGGIVAPPVAGWVYDTRGNYEMVWIALSVLAVFAALLVLMSHAHRVKERTRNPKVSQVGSPPLQ